jgi:hypothetical protein
MATAKKILTTDDNSSLAKLYVAPKTKFNISKHYYLLTCQCAFLRVIDIYVIHRA